MISSLIYPGSTRAFSTEKSKAKLVSCVHGLLVGAVLPVAAAFPSAHAAEIGSNCLREANWSLLSASAPLSDAISEGPGDVRVLIEGIGDVDLDLRFLSLSKDQQNEMIAVLAGAFEARRTGALCSLDIKGGIARGDADRLKHVASLLDATGINQKRLYLDSNGGLVTEAMEMGRFLRSHGYTAVVDMANRCESACVLTYAGAIRRVLHLDGQVRIHRPSLPDDILASLSAEQAEDAYRELYSEVASFIGEMRVDRRLYEEMQRIPINRSRELGILEMLEMRLVGWDPVAYDRERAAITTRYGDPGRQLIQVTSDQTEFIIACALQHSSAVERKYGASPREAEDLALVLYWYECSERARNAGFDLEINELVDEIVDQHGLDWADGWFLKLRVKDLAEALS